MQIKKYKFNLKLFFKNYSVLWILIFLIFLIWLLIKALFFFQIIKLDADQDGIINQQDAMPHNHDNEGKDDDFDIDDDNDGILDTADPLPFDHDNDGITDKDDQDNDNDGILDSEDQFLLDHDNDGTADWQDWQWKSTVVDKFIFKNNNR